MIQQLKDLPANCVGFRATDEVSKADFIDVVIPAVEELIARTGQINYMLVLDTSLRKFTAGAWLQDALMGLKHLAKWHRAAIITDLSSIQTFTAIFSAVIPGEFKGFDHADYNKAVSWVSETA